MIYSAISLSLLPFKSLIFRFVPCKNWTNVALNRCLEALTCCYECFCLRIATKTAFQCLFVMQMIQYISICYEKTCSTSNQLSSYYLSCLLKVLFSESCNHTVTSWSFHATFQFHFTSFGMPFFSCFNLTEFFRSVFTL